MTIIEGVGDEVTQFFLVVFCGIIAVLAWASTAQRPHRFRTAVILDRNVRHVYRFLPLSGTGRRQTQHMLIINRNLPQNDNRIPASEISAESSIRNTPEPVSIDNTESNNASSDNFENSSREQLVEDMEMNSIVNAMDSENSVLRNRRLAFFENRSGDPADSSRSEPSTVVSDEIHIPLNVKNEKEDEIDEINKNETISPPSDSVEEKVEESKDDKNIESTEKPDNSDNIRIRLKYLNDDLKLVEGSLQEPLGEFKRRHFKVELNARKLVRLIFNGQVLQREAATLQSCGLFDNCVVHCLVHQPRTRQQFVQVQQQLSPTNIPLVNINNSHIGEHGTNQIPTIVNNGMQEDRDWDLSHILFTLLASLLTIAWYIHLRFSGLFGLPASLAMIGLTGIYFVAVICVYFSETQPFNNANNVNNVPLETAETNNTN